MERLAPSVMVGEKVELNKAPILRPPPPLSQKPRKELKGRHDGGSDISSIAPPLVSGSLNPQLILFSLYIYLGWIPPSSLH